MSDFLFITLLLLGFSFIFWATSDLKNRIATFVEGFMVAEAVTVVLVSLYEDSFLTMIAGAICLVVIILAKSTITKKENVIGKEIIKKKPKPNELAEVEAEDNSWDRCIPYFPVPMYSDDKTK